MIDHLKWHEHYGMGTVGGGLSGSVSYGVLRLQTEQEYCCETISFWDARFPVSHGEVFFREVAVSEAYDIVDNCNEWVALIDQWKIYLQTRSMIHRNCSRTRVQHRSRMSRAELCRDLRCSDASSWRYFCTSHWSVHPSSQSSSSCSSSAPSVASSHTDSLHQNHFLCHDLHQSFFFSFSGPVRERIPGLSPSLTSLTVLKKEWKSNNNQQWDSAAWIAWRTGLMRWLLHSQCSNLWEKLAPGLAESRHYQHQHHFVIETSD